MVQLAKFDISLKNTPLPRRFGASLYRKLAEVSSDFFLNFSCAHKHSRQSSYKNFGKTQKTKGIYRKTRKPLRIREYLDGRPKPENVHQNLFDDIFCYKLPTEIIFKYMH